MESGSWVAGWGSTEERVGSCEFWWLNMVKGWDWRMEEEIESGVER